MYQGLSTRRALRRIAPSSTDLERFRPLAAQARKQVDELVARGAVVEQVTQDQVVLRRLQSRAVIDRWGRVIWTGIEPKRSRAI